MRTPALTYSPPPRLARLRRDRRRSAVSPLSAAASARLEHMMLARFMSRAVAAVNERGLCAAELARLAELPPGEVLTMVQRCLCPACWHARAN